MDDVQMAWDAVRVAAVDYHHNAYDDAGRGTPQFERLAVAYDTAISELIAAAKRAAIAECQQTERCYRRQGIEEWQQHGDGETCLDLRQYKVDAIPLCPPCKARERRAGATEPAS